MKNRKVRSKKRRIKWREVIFALGNKQCIADFYDFCNYHRLSDNRCALYVLHHHYSTTTIALIRDLYEDYGCEYKSLQWALDNVPRANWL